MAWAGPKVCTKRRWSKTPVRMTPAREQQADVARVRAVPHRQRARHEDRAPDDDVVALRPIPIA
jgi:hypothetical protein